MYSTNGLISRAPSVGNPLVTKSSRLPQANGRHRVDIASIRRAEIIEAAVAVIAEEGIQELSLSAIEARCGMSRGQLTYYFKSKEDILLAVFDRLLALMYERVTHGHEMPARPSGWEMSRHLLQTVLEQAPIGPEFHSLQYTFLSQISHREDFRRRLAALYQGWREHMVQGLKADRRHGAKAVPPREMASLVQAILHGLSIQLVADPRAFDRGRMLELCLDVLGNFLGVPANKKIAGHKKPAALNGKPQRSRPLHAR